MEKNFHTLSPGEVILTSTWFHLSFCCCCCLVAKSHPFFCDAMNCSLPVHGISQSSILEWVAISFSGVSSWPRDQTQISCIAVRFFNDWAPTAKYWWRISQNRVGWSHFIDTRLMGTRLCQTVYHTSLVQTLCLMYAFNTCLYISLLPGFYKPLIENNGCHIDCSMEQQTGSKLGKEYAKAVYCHPSYLIYILGTSCEIQAGWSTSWNQDFWEKYQ